MSLRIYSAALALLALAACSVKREGDSGTGQDGTQETQAVPAQVPCALGGAETYTSECAVERVVRDGRTILTVRHPDGGFRRLVELDGGARYAAADGSEPARIEANGGEIEVTVADDHYLFPRPATADAPPR